jgi:AraC family transcriptional regulator, positive regulator of tynA and feaB
MAMVFSTQGVQPRERLSYWRATASAREVDLTARPGFLATLRNQRLDNLGISELDCEPCVIRRTAHNIARAGCDHFLLSMQLSGRAVVAQQGRDAIYENAGFVLVDTRHPYEMRLRGDTKAISLVIPRQAFEERLGDAAATLAARAMNAGGPLTGIAAAFLAMLPSRIEAMDQNSAARLAEQTLDLIALAFSMESGKPVTLASSRAVALYRLKAVIEAQLCDPALKPAAVASAAGVSIRYANVLLSQEGSSIERYILRRRLERARRTLEDPNQAQRLVSEIAFAWGFRDLSHFARKFRIAYGLTPGDCRRRAQEEEHAAKIETKNAIVTT